MGGLGSLRLSGPLDSVWPFDLWECHFPALSQTTEPLHALERSEREFESIERGWACDVETVRNHQVDDVLAYSFLTMVFDRVT